jgi:hypothetical protein
MKQKDLISISYETMTRPRQPPRPPGARSGKTPRLRLLGLALGLVAAPCLAPAALAEAGGDPLAAAFDRPPPDASPWAYWYWMEAAVSKEGITADLEAMRAAGLGGAFLMSIRGPADPPVWDPPVNQLSPEWWGMVRHAMDEAERLGLELAMHACDGFAVAGGPWVTPELSMQKVVWSLRHVEADRELDLELPQPPANAGYYRDIALFAFPAYPGAGIDSRSVPPAVTTSLPGIDAAFLADGQGRDRLRHDSTEPMWIQYAFAEPFTARSLVLNPDGRDFQSRRLSIHVSDDGEHFRQVYRLESPRHGWQDYEQELTYALPPVTARYFRFHYDPAGSEPGAEDLDTAKWRPRLRIRGLLLSSEPRIHQYEGKNGGIWRVSPRTTGQQVPADAAVPPEAVIDISRHMDATGRLRWRPPATGRWTILRMGHTSTGHTNATGGAGVGLEVDKFNPAAARLQFDKWFGEALRQAGPELAGRVLSVLHNDSWECGSQNWSPVFRAGFQRRRGYDPVPWLPAMAGIVIGGAEQSERFLHDIRETIGELIMDNYFGVMRELAHEAGCHYTGEATAPVTVADGLRHFDFLDVPMAEFWLRSPTHDKPNDTLDAVSGAHVYGKPVVAVEAFTQVRMAWDEHPGMLKALGDRNFALGFNRFVYHVFVHNPWIDRQPGMTLGGVGLFFQRDQTWWEPGRAWVDYKKRAQVLLQQGAHVADIAVFIGEDMPRRAVLPERLALWVPGLVGREAYLANQLRRINRHLPQQEEPMGVINSANMARPEDWTDALRGYKYDSVNRDALLRLAEVRNGRIEFPGGASYGILIIPGSRAMSPEGARMSLAMARRIGELAQAGATIVVHERPRSGFGFQDDEQLAGLVDRWWPYGWEGVREVGDGLVLRGPLWYEDLSAFGMQRDFFAREPDGSLARRLAWTHRRGEGLDVYFISNQTGAQRELEASLRAAGRVPELWDAVTGERRAAPSWRIEDGRTLLPLRLAPAGSVFIVMRDAVERTGADAGPNWHDPRPAGEIAGPWRVRFDVGIGGPADPVVFERLTDWTRHADPAIRHYSGTAAYRNNFEWNTAAHAARRVWLDVGRVGHIAEIAVNGIPCGVAWTDPYRVEITGALRDGANDILIEVTNPWRNRLIGDHGLPEAERVTFARAPYRLEGQPLQPSGLFGPVRILVE